MIFIVSVMNYNFPNEIGVNQSNRKKLHHGELVCGRLDNRKRISFIFSKSMISA